MDLINLSWKVQHSLLRKADIKPRRSQQISKGKVDQTKDHLFFFAGSQTVSSIGVIESMGSRV